MDLHNLSLFNLLFYTDKKMEIGFATKTLLEKLLNEGNRSVNNDQQFSRFLMAARAFYIRTYAHALDNLSRNDELLINARVLNFKIRRSRSTSIDQLLYFKKWYVM